MHTVTLHRRHREHHIHADMLEDRFSVKYVNYLLPKLAWKTRVNHYSLFIDWSS